MRFTERSGKRQIKTDIQSDWMNDELRNGLWNVIYSFIMEDIKNAQSLYNSGHKDLIESIWFSFLKEPIDTIPYGANSTVEHLRKLFFNWEYLDVYDFIDFIAQQDGHFDNSEYIDSCNFILKREISGYRFVNQLLAPIINEIEIIEIEKAIANSKRNEFNGVSIHLASALEKISDRKNPDYRNSIKESISAVESICQIISKQKGTELGKTLKLLKTMMPLHGALEQGYSKIYGYTSDSDGIRHAMMDSDNLDQEDAMYMLVSCSAFTNYLIIKAEKSNLID